jgi:hypothetical protein
LIKTTMASAITTKPGLKMENVQARVPIAVHRDRKRVAAKIRVVARVEKKETVPEKTMTIARVPEKETAVKDRATIVAARNRPSAKRAAASLKNNRY